MIPQELINFVTESNRIEGILREPTDGELEVHQWVLAQPKLTVCALTSFVTIVQPGAHLRWSPGMDVRVGKYIAPPGGPGITAELKHILKHLDLRNAYQTHLAYESLHPFTDGNGRSGRVLWLHQMGGKAPLGFLHQFYYQTLGALGGD